MKINFNSRKIFGGIIGIVLFSLCIIGITFAFYSWRNTSDTDVAVGFTVDDLGGAIIYSRDNGDGTGKITGTLTEDNGYKTSATITLYKRNIDKDLYGHIYLNVNSLGSYLAKEKALKWAIYEGNDDSGNLINSGNFNGEAVNNKIPLDVNIPLSSTETQYTIVIYLDADEVNDFNIVNDKIVTEISAEASDVAYENSLYINSIGNDGYNLIATARDFANDIVSYAVTTTNTVPTSWTTLTSAKEQTINYTVSSEGTYYVWVRNVIGDVVSKSVDITSFDTVIDISDVIITNGDINSTYFNSDSIVSVPLIINSAKDITDGLSSDEIKVLINNTEVINITKTLEVSDNNNKFYTLILEGLSSDGSLSLHFDTDAVKNSDGEGNNSTNLNIGTVDNIKPVCSFSSVTSVIEGEPFTVELTCTDNGSGLVWSGITADRLTTLDNDVKIVSVSTPTAINDGYKYTITLNTNKIKEDGYNLVLKSDTVWDNSGNYNDELNASIMGPIGDTYTVTFVKGDNVSSIGSTSLSCTTVGDSNSCEVIAPAITPNSGYGTLGWALEGSSNYILPGEKITVDGNSTYLSYVYDNEAPTASIESTANLKVTSQTATLKCTDNVGVVSYYWGTEEPSSSTIYTSISSTTNMSVTRTINTSGTYYLSCKDALGNTSNSATKVYNSYTIYDMLLNVTGSQGTYTTANYTRTSSNTYLAPSGTSLTLASVYTIPMGASSSTFKGVSTGVASTYNSSVSNTTPVLNSNATYTTWFDRLTYSITVSAGIGGSNKVVSENNSTGVTATSGTTTSLDGVRYAEKITATATADSDYMFSEFSGLSTSNASPVVVTITGSGTIKANFLSQSSEVYTATFYYVDDGNVRSASTSCTVSDSTCDVTIPTTVRESTGQYGNSYVGLNTSLNTMNTTISGGASSVTLDSNTNYYAIYRSNVSIYRPTSSSVASAITVYRNSYFTSTSAVNNVLSTSSTGTSTFSSVSGLYGTLSGFATSVNSTYITYSTIDALLRSTSTVVYAISSDNITVTFYYNSNTNVGSLTASTTTSSGTRKYYCRSTTATTTYEGSVSIPSSVSNSVGRYNTPYYGVASTTNTHTTVSPSTAITTYYAIYGGGKTTGGTNAVSSVVNIYYPSSTTGCSRVSTAYRNEFFTSNNSMTAVIGNSATATTNLSVSITSGYTFNGFATSAYSTNVAYSSVSAAATSSATTLYAHGEKNTTIRFYYNGNTNLGYSNIYSYDTVGVQNNYCTSTSYATVDSEDVAVPSVVTNSVGKWNSSYKGVSNSLSSMSVITPTTDYETYYAVYSSPVNIYYPSSSSSCSRVSSAYRNEYLTSTSAMNVVIGNSATATTNLNVSITSGYTFDGFATVASSTSSTYSSVSAAANSSANTLYAHGKKSVSVRFYYNSNTSSGYFTARYSVTSGEQTNYCKDSSSATLGNQQIAIPSVVTNSVGKWNSEYKGVSKSSGDMSVATPSTASTTYYAFYSSPVTLYYPSSETVCSKSNLIFYRNEYFTSTSAMSAAIASSSSSTSSETISISGVDLAGFAPSVNNYSPYSFDNLVNNSSRTFYGIVNDPLEITFYYNDFTSYGTVNMETVTDDYDRSRYCTSTSSAATTDVVFNDIPYVVQNSKGPYNTEFADNLALSLNSMSGIADLSTAYDTYYAIYQEQVTRNYYDSVTNSWSDQIIYRNSYFTSVSGNGAMNTVLSSSQTGTSNVSYSNEKGPGNANFAGLSLEEDGAVNYANASNAATAATRYTKLYTIYKVYSVGSSCSATTYANTLEFAINRATAISSTSSTTICPQVTHTDSSQVTVPSGKTIILDLNGKTITKTSTITNSGTFRIRGSSGTLSSSSFANGGLILNLGGTLYIGESGATNGFTIQDNRSCTDCGYTIYNGAGTLYMYGGTVTTNDRAITTSTGRAYIYGGNVTATNYVNPLTLSGNGTLQIGNNDGSVSQTSPVIRGNLYLYTSGSNSVNFYDGIIYHNSYPFANTSSTINTPSGYYPITTVSNSIYTTVLSVSGYYGISTSSSCGDYSGYTHYLEEAFDIAPSGSTICLIQEAFNDNSSPNNTKTLTLNLNGFRLNKTTDQITNSGTLTINGGNSNGILSSSSLGGTIIDNSGTLNLGTSSSSAFKILNNDTVNDNGYTINNQSGATLNIKGISEFRAYDRGIANYGTLNISGGNIYLNSGYSGTNLIGLYSGSKTTISGGYIYNYSSGNGIYFFNSNASLTISGGQIHSEGDYAINSSAYGGTIDMSDGRVQVVDGIAFSVGSSGTFNMSGGTISSITDSGISDFTLASQADPLVYLSGSAKFNMTNDSRIYSRGPYAVATTTSYTGTVTINATPLESGYGQNAANITTSSSSVTKPGIHFPSTSGTLNIQNGLIYTHRNGVYTVGTTNITGGTIRVNAGASDVANHVALNIGSTSRNVTIGTSSGSAYTPIIWNDGTATAIYVQNGFTGDLNIYTGVIYSSGSTTTTGALGIAGNALSMYGSGRVRIWKAFVESVNGRGIQISNGTLLLNDFGTNTTSSNGAYVASVNRGALFVSASSSVDVAVGSLKTTATEPGPTIMTGGSGMHAIAGEGSYKSVRIRAGRIYARGSSMFSLSNIVTYSGTASSGGFTNTWSQGAGCTTSGGTDSTHLCLDDNFSITYTYKQTIRGTG